MSSPKASLVLFGRRGLAGERGLGLEIAALVAEQNLPAQAIDRLVAADIDEPGARIGRYAARWPLRDARRRRRPAAPLRRARNRRRGGSASRARDPPRCRNTLSMSHGAHAASLGAVRSVRQSYPSPAAPRSSRTSPRARAPRSRWPRRDPWPRSDSSRRAARASRRRGRRWSASCRRAPAPWSRSRSRCSASPALKLPLLMMDWVKAPYSRHHRGHVGLAPSRRLGFVGIDQQKVLHRRSPLPDWRHPPSSSRMGRGRIDSAGLGQAKIISRIANPESSSH